MSKGLKCRILLIDVWSTRAARRAYPYGFTRRPAAAGRRLPPLKNRLTVVLDVMMPMDGWRFAPLARVSMYIIVTVVGKN
jgi:hypothetical protein